MDEIQYERMQEEIAFGEAMVDMLKEFLEFNGADNLGQFRRNTYKYVPCGPWVSFRLHDGSWCHSGDDRADDIDFIGSVDALQVGSIVENSDATVIGNLLELKDNAELLNAAVNDQIEYVNEEAISLWDAANKEWEDACDEYDEEDEEC
jgi:hypothetical protein